MLYKTPDVAEPTEWNNVFAIIRELFVRIFKNSWDTFKSLSCGLLCVKNTANALIDLIFK